MITKNLEKNASMTLKELEEIVVIAFCDLKTMPLKQLESSMEYSFNDKEEFIQEINLVFKKIKSKGIYNLIAKPSKCKYCYPYANAYSFHHPETEEFVLRYVIHQESESVFRVEECKNIPPRADGMPF